MEVTWDYGACAESDQELSQSSCLCGQSECRGSYLAAPEPDRHNASYMLLLLVEACKATSVSKIDQDNLDSAGFGVRLLPDTAPTWLKCYCARVIGYLKDHGSGSDWQNLAVMADIVQSLLRFGAKEQAAAGQAAAVPVTQVYICAHASQSRLSHSRLFFFPRVFPPPGSE